MPATNSSSTPRGSSGGGGHAAQDGVYASGLPAEVTAAVASTYPTNDPLDRPVSTHDRSTNTHTHTRLASPQINEHITLKPIAHQ